MAETFDITSQTPTTIVGADRVVAPAMEVSFVTKPSGVVGVVKVPAAIYTTDEVKRVVEAQAAILENVQHL